MKKFIIHSLKGEFSVVEVDCEFVSPMEDPSVLWLKDGEFKVKITAPSFLLEKKVKGKETIYAPAYYYFHSVFDSQEQALDVLKIDIRKSMQRDAEKRNLSLNEEDVIKAINEIKIINL